MLHEVCVIVFGACTLDDPRGTGEVLWGSLSSLLSRQVGTLAQIHWSHLIPIGLSSGTTTTKKFDLYILIYTFLKPDPG